MDDAIALLERTPRTLDSLLRGLPDDWVRSNEGGETWSPFDVIGHLIHGELTDWVPRARIILDQGEGRRSTSSIGSRNSKFPGRTLDSLLDEFATLRRDNLSQLMALRVTEADLDRKGRHPELGPVTLRQLLSTWVAHDLDHVVQISRTLAWARP